MTPSSSASRARIESPNRATDPQPSATRADPAHLPPTETPATRPTRRGRPGAMTPEMLESARRMRDSGGTIDEIATEFDVSRATLYRHLGKQSSKL
ncbi:helix-turn-helix domain-containing protein [Nocardia sp. NPDC051990]|uniref:helix-turn-helix domain-containing protein n=1 Tax=Nocardia sp. NPDC051990 TaxID=3155285 RepID=UPI00343AF3FC